MKYDNFNQYRNRTCVTFTIKMYLIVSFLLALCLQNEGVEILAQEPSAYCFQFTWLGPMIDDDKKIKVNCTALKHSPCFLPFVVPKNSAPPNTTELWSSENKRKYSCPLNPGYVCIKHTFIYNNAVINSTHFCGKMVEDKTSAVTSGCFKQEVDGHTIESCSCLSDQGMRPCNSAKINQHSFMFLLILLLMYIV